MCLFLGVVREYRSRFASEETASFCLNVMVGVIILYDYVHPVGAFAKSSKIDVSPRVTPWAVRKFKQSHFGPFPPD